MTQFVLAIFLLNLADACDHWNSNQGWGSIAIALVLFAILIYREFIHRQRIQTLLAETQRVKASFDTNQKQVEKKLQESEARLQTLIDNLPFNCWICDAEGKHLMQNAADTQQWGNLVGLRYEDADLPPETLQLFTENRQRVLSGKVWRSEWQYESGGEVQSFMSILAPIYHEQEIQGLLGVSIDITEQKQTEEALRSRNQELLTLYRISEISLRNQSSKAIFQSIVEEISAATGFPIVAIELYDRARQVMMFEGIKGIELGDKILAIPAAQTLSGTVAQTGRPIVKHHGPEGCEECADHEDLDQLHIRTFVCLPMTVNQDSVGVLSLAHPDIIQVNEDMLRWLGSLANYLALIIHRQQLETSLQQANIDLEMQVAEQTLELREAIVQLEQEIRDRQQTEAALRESEERFRRIFDNAPIGIAVANVADYQFLMINQAFCQLLGYTEAELLAHSYLSVSHPEDWEKDKPFSMQMMAGELNSYQLEKRYLKKNQQVVWGTLTATAVRDQKGDVLYVVGMVQDITERRQAQLALQEAHEKLTHWVGDLEQRHREMTLLNEMSDLMQACLTVDEAYIVIAQFMPKLFPDCAGAVYTIGESKTLVEAVTTWGEAIASELLFVPNDCFALRRGQPHYVEGSHNVESSHRSLCCKHLQKPLPASSFCVPMVAQGETAGILYLSLPTQSLTQPKQQLATTVARQFALGIANLKLYTTLQNQSIRDPLTGLFNRRYLNEFLDRELRRAERNQQVLSVLLLDVDHFKRFNDTFGHDAGDAVLRCLSEFLQTSVRSSDIACRYGGEEMVLVLLDASLENTLQRAEQLRQGVKHLKVEYPQSVGAITISIGVACFPEHGSTSEALLQSADQALYQAKAAGRDQWGIVGG